MLQVILTKFYLHDINKFNNKILNHLIILFCIKCKKRKFELTFINLLISGLLCAKRLRSLKKFIISIFFSFFFFLIEWILFFSKIHILFHFTLLKFIIRQFSSSFQVVRHLDDEKWYPAFGGVLRVITSLEDAGTILFLICNFPTYDILVIVFPCQVRVSRKEEKAVPIKWCPN